MQSKTRRHLQVCQQCRRRGAQQELAEPLRRPPVQLAVDVQVACPVLNAAAADKQLEGAVEGVARAHLQPATLGACGTANTVTESITRCNRSAADEQMEDTVEGVARTDLQPVPLGACGSTERKNGSFVV